jgi:hypothetical protein
LVAVISFRCALFGRKALAGADPGEEDVRPAVLRLRRCEAEGGGEAFA